MSRQKRRCCTPRDTIRFPIDFRAVADSEEVPCHTGVTDCNPWASEPFDTGLKTGVGRRERFTELVGRAAELRHFAGAGSTRREAHPPSWSQTPQAPRLEAQKITSVGGPAAVKVPRDRRDVAHHIREAFSGPSAGSLLTVAQTVAARTSQYEAGEISAGAVAGRLPLTTFPASGPSPDPARCPPARSPDPSVPLPGGACPVGRGSRHRPGPGTRLVVLSARAEVSRTLPSPPTAATWSTGDSPPCLAPGGREATAAASGIASPGARGRGPRNVTPVVRASHASG